VPLLLLVFAWTSVTYWISARAAERRMRERYALLKHLSERPAESVQAVLEQLRQDDAREEEHRRAKAAFMRRGKLEGGFIMMAGGAALAVFLYFLGPRTALWAIGLMPMALGVVLAVSAWLEKSKGE
jgi:VIT1/CCC1 family predicted Fe2+/Mn2+ transporter